MKNIKICSFVSSYTHSIIVSNNFISREYKNEKAKVIYISQNSDKEKVDKIVDEYFRDNLKEITYTEWLNENIINDYANENIILVINGSEKFINKVNKYISFSNIEAVIINSYNVTELKSGIDTIISKHDYYLNTQGIQIKNNRTC